MKKIHLHSLLAVSLLMLLPSVASAATNQQVFDSAITETFNKDAALRIDSRFDVKLGETRISDKRQVSQLDTTIHFMSRRRPNNGTRQDYEGQLVVEKLSASGLSLPAPFKLSNPLSIEWKKIADTGYYRLKTDKLPDELAQLLGPDITPFIGQWMQSSPQEIKDSATSLGSSALDLKDNPITDEKVDSTGLKDLQVVKVLKTEKRKNGDVVYRYSMRVNPAAIAKYEKDGLDEINKSTRADKADAIKKFKISVADLRRGLTHTWFAATVNSTNKTLERLEIQGWADWSNTDKDGKPTTVKATYNIGLTFMRDGNWEVVKPANSLDLNAVFAFLLTRLFMGTMTTQEQTPAVSEPAQGQSEAVTNYGLGYAMVFPAGWDTQNRLRFGADSQPIDETLDDAHNIDGLWKMLRTALVDGAVSVDGMKQVRETLVSDITLPTDASGEVAGARYTMTRWTADANGWVTDDVIIAPNQATGQVIALVLEAPVDLSGQERSMVSQLLASYKLIGFLP